MNRPLMALAATAALLVGSCGTPTTSSPAGPAGPSGGVVGRSPVADVQAGSPDGTALEAPTADGATSKSRSASLVLYANPDRAVLARSRPSADAEVVASVQSRTGQPQPFLALMSFAEYEARLADGAPEWIEVLLPVRPNGRTGWIPMNEVSPYRVGYEINIDISDFRLTVVHDGKTMVDAAVALGNRDTPTPIGRFYLIELIRSNDPGGVYGPYAFGLSGYSETLDTFGTGNGLIGIHGTNQPEAIGTFVSHGCIRLANDVIEELAAVLPLGTPVNIVG